MVEAPSFRRDAHRRGGFTLIEVVLALAIFVFGALAIIRIFPSALGVIQNSGDRLTAVNLNRSVLARYARNPELVPDGIYDDPADPRTANWRDNIVGAVAGSPRRNNAMPSSSINDVETEYNFSALGHFKSIKSERHVVPANGIVFTQFPYETQTPGISPIFFLEDSVSNVILNSNGELDFSQSVQASTGMPYVRAVGDFIYISYNWIEDGQRWGVQEEPIRVTAPTVPTPPPLTVTQNARLATPVQIVADQITVRLRRAPATAPTLTPADSNIGMVNLTAFAGQTVSIDYQVKDWRWLVFDGVPSDNPNTNTPVGTQKVINVPVKALDDQKSPAFVYTSLRSQTQAPDNRSSASPGGTLVDISRKTGQVIFETSTLVGETPQARVVYWTADNWASQLSVAARSYLLTYTASSAEPWRDCGFDGTNRNFLYFKPSEAGKTLLISYNTTNTSVPPTEGRVVTIDNTIIDAPTGIPGGLAVGNRVSRLQLNDNVTSIREIRGVSIQARTAWLDGNNFTQTSSVGFREVNN